MIFLLAGLALAEEGEVQLRATAMELPYQLRGETLGLQQSQDIAYAVNRSGVMGVQAGMHRLFPDKPDLAKGLGLAGVGALGIGWYLVGSWNHEEWHRAVMSNQGIDSRNGWYHREAWNSGTISVDRVSDGELSGLKKRTPQETVRLMTVGMEAEHALAERMGRELFLHGEERSAWGPTRGADSWMAPVIAIHEVAPAVYTMLCSSELADEEVAALEQTQDVTSERDFTGLDCLAWVYDLHRGDEPYADRGPHPTGVGVDRYIRLEDLSATERAYLAKQRPLQLLNLVNPHMVGVNWFALPDGSRLIANLGHELTPFGYVVDVDWGWSKGDLAVLGSVHNYWSGRGWSPGLELEIAELPIGPRVQIGALAEYWVQPAGLRFAAVRRAGVRVQGELSVRALSRLDVWVQAGAKTEGWSAGVLQLDRSLSANAGLTFHLDTVAR